MKTLILRTADNTVRVEIKADIFATNDELQTAGFDTRFTNMELGKGYNDEAKALMNLHEIENSWVGIKQLATDTAGIGLYLLDLSEAGAAAVSQESTCTLTGTSGKAKINVAGSDYMAEFNTDLTTTADDFVTDFAAIILSTHAITVTADAGVLTFVGAPGASFTLTSTNDTGNLNGTEVVVTASVAPGEVVIVAP